MTNWDSINSFSFFYVDFEQFFFGAMSLNSMKTSSPEVIAYVVLFSYLMLIASTCSLCPGIQEGSSPLKCNEGEKLQLLFAGSYIDVCNYDNIPLAASPSSSSQLRNFFLKSGSHNSSQLCVLGGVYS